MIFLPTFRTIYAKPQYLCCRVVASCSPDIFAVLQKSKKFEFPEEDDLSFFDPMFKVS